MISFFLVWILAIKGTRAEIPSLKVGMLLPNNSALDKDVGFETSAGAMTVALNLAIKNQIYDPSKYNITFTWNHTQCDEALAVGYTSNMIKHQNISVMFGPTCIESAEAAGSLATYYRIPIFLWSTMNSEFFTRKKYPTSIPAAGTVAGLVLATSNVFKQYNWTQVGFLYTAAVNGHAEHVPFCTDYADTFQKSIATYLVNITTYIRFANNNSVTGFQSILNAMKTRSRIIVACVESRLDRQNLMLAAYANNMTGPDYVYLFIQTSATGFENPPFWDGTGSKFAIIKEAAKSVLILDKYAEETPMKQSVDKEIVGNIRNWPFYCKDCPTNVNASNLAFYLGDSFYMYLQALNWTYTKYGPSQLTNATAVLERISKEAILFPSIMGNNFTIQLSYRLGRYAVWGLDSNSTPTIWALSFVGTSDTGSAFKTNYQQESNSIWFNRGGKKPLSVPICGFNNVCPPSPIFYVAIVVAALFLFASVIIGLGLLICIFQRQQRRRLNALWQIPFTHLQKPSGRKSSIQESSRSSRSILSGTSQSSNNSNNTLRKETQNTEYFIYCKELVVAQKFKYNGRWSSSEEEEFQKMRKLSNPNLNHFLGISVNGPDCYVLWGYCDRGNLVEVIKTHSSKIDEFVIIAMMREICQGLHYIHKSSFVQHGNLNAYCCVVGDRFDVKIQLYGLSKLKSRMVRRQNSKCALYVAPEHLQDQNKIGSQAGDIYSFAIIASVIITMKPAFGIEDTNAINIIETTVQNIAAGRYPPTRPSLQTENGLEINSDLVSLVTKMWSEHPSERLKIDEVYDLLFNKLGGTRKSANLMDHMFALMENSANDLEQEVKMRSLELENEQKKANVLLYRIMPREAADMLKLGQTVAPEVFESCTVFFSDIVSFTVLASKSTPLQIINFLNDVYTLADSIMDKYDCYKVETIGDGMHVVSGVPKRNGTAHVKAILEMAIDFQRSVKTLRLSHLPNESIQMRVGVHSGSSVAGIVGVTNPRFIVLGDTVNTSAKMEASGKAGRIHITKETKNLVDLYYPNQFHIFNRGETLIKGIGPMETYWAALPEEAPHFKPR